MSETRKERRLRKLRSAFEVAMSPWLEPLENGEDEKTTLYTNAVLRGLKEGQRIAEFVIREEE